MTTSDPRPAAVDALARLPLFQLSTAAMELFHTNMLYWLALHQPAESAPVWNALGLRSVRADGQEPFIKREWRRLDLVFRPGLGDETLVIENKIGAIPTREQLIRYAGIVAGLAPSLKLGELRLVLLTLTAPSFELPGPWRSVLYRDLLDELRETAHRATGDAHLISAYVELVTRLDAVARAYDADTNLDEPVLLSVGERKHLARERLLSLVEKVRADRFAQLATRAQPPEIARIGPVAAGLSNTAGRNDWFAMGRPGHLFGWQIQGRQFRLAVVLTAGPHTRTREAREQLVTDHYSDYFDDFPPEALQGKLTPYQGELPWLCFDPDMVYRYATLTPDTTWHDLLDLTTWFSHHAYEYASKHSEGGRITGLAPGG